MWRNSLQVYSGKAHGPLAQQICDYLMINLGAVDIGRFPDGEINIKVNEDVRGADVFVIQPTCHPVNENLMELLILIDCLRRASADRITAVIPYYGYARKDRKDEGRVPITAKLVANLITKAGADRVLTMDLHADQIQGFFDIPVDHLFAGPVLIAYFKQLAIDNLVIVSPDMGSVKRARAYASRLNADIAIVDKRRDPITGEVKGTTVIGDVKNKNALVCDDMISTGGSITEACRIIKDHGVGDIYVCATHAVLCGDALGRLSQAPIKEIVVSNTIPLRDKHLPNLKVISVADYLGEAILRIHRKESVSYLFKTPRETVNIIAGR